MRFGKNALKLSNQKCKQKISVNEYSPKSSLSIAIETMLCMSYPFMCGLYILTYLPRLQKKREF